MALVTTQSKPFMQLVDLQQKSLNTLNDIKDSVGKTADSKTSSIQVEQLATLKRMLDVEKSLLAINKKTSDKQLKDMSELSKSMKGWKTWGDRIKDMTRSIGDNLNPTALSKKLFGAFNIGGVFNKKIAALDYTQQRKAVGDTGKDVGKRGKQYADSLYRGLRAQDQLDKMRASGASDDDIKSTKKGRSVLRAVSKSERELGTLSSGRALDSKSPQDAANKMGGNTAGRSTALGKTPSDKGLVAQSTTDVLAEKQTSSEQQLESLRQSQLQTDLLTQIAVNTSALRGSGGSSAGGAEDKGAQKGSGMLGGIGKGIKGIGSAVSGVGKGLAAVGLGIGMFFTGVMKGIADGIAAFGTGKVLKGVAVLGTLTGVMWGFTEVIQKWAKIDWDTITKAGVAIGGLMILGQVAGKAVGGLLQGALGLGALGAAVWVIGKGMNEMGEGLKNFVDGLERLSNIKAQGLFDVAGGMTALSGAFLAFGAGQAAEGLGNLVSRFLTIGTDSPVERLIKIGEVGPGVKQAAEGLQTLSGAMKSFGSVDASSMKGVKEFPWEQATKFAAAGGAMSVAGTKVYNASKGNADGQAQVNAQGKPQASTNVSTAVQNNTTNNQVIKLPSRNTESSYSAYSRSRYV
jgi:hypothetical protein